jgi:hypothetical protein
LLQTGSYDKSAKIASGTQIFAPPGAVDGVAPGGANIAFLRKFNDIAHKNVIKHSLEPAVRAHDRGPQSRCIIYYTLLHPASSRFCEDRVRFRFGFTSLIGADA